MRLEATLSIAAYCSEIVSIYRIIQHAEDKLGDQGSRRLTQPLDPAAAFADPAAAFTRVVRWT